MFGKSGSAITEQLLKHPNGDFDVAPFVHSRVKASLPEIQAAIDGSICFQQAEKLRLIRQHLDNLDTCKASLDALIDKCSLQFQPQIELIMTVPGIQRFSAISIISEIGVDMSVFPTAKHLCFWTGLVPQNDQSAGKKKTTRISRAGSYIKPLLVRCAISAIASKKHPEIKERYRAIEKRRGRKKARIAIYRMLLTAIYAMLVKAEPYDSSHYRMFDSRPANRSITPDEAVQLARRLGYTVKEVKAS